MANDAMDNVKAKPFEKGIVLETLNFEGKQVKDAQTRCEFIPFFTAGGYGADSSGGCGGGGSVNEDKEDDDEIPEDPKDPDDTDEDPDEDLDEDEMRVYIKKREPLLPNRHLASSRCRIELCAEPSSAGLCEAMLLNRR